MTESITEEQLTNYIKIYEETFGRSIPRKAAYAQAIQLLNFTKATIDHAVKTSKSQEPEASQDYIVNKR